MSRLNRTYSSPTLSANTLSSSRYRSSPMRQERESQGNKFGYLCETDEEEEEEDQEFYVIGDRVFVDGHKPASVAYFGEVEFAPGDWVGVVMDNPLGNHNGKVHGREYYQCAPFHGLFVRPHRVARMPDSALGRSSASSSRSATPLPTLHQRPYSAANSSSSSSSSRRSYGVRSPGASSSTTDSSYFYDDDYRQSRLPTIASLGQKMDEIESTASRPQSLERHNRRAATLATPPPPVGILKKSSSLYRQSPLEPRSRSETRQSSHYEPTRYDNVEVDPKVPVFNFRPRRAKLDQLQRELGSTNGEKHMGERILSDVSNKTGGGIVDLSSEPANVGDRVWVRSDRGDTSGVLRFMGETNFATGEWAGIELDQPEGKNDGSVLGHRYFYCPQKYGLFVPATRVRKQTGQPGFKAMRSTILSPPPPLKSHLSSSYESGSYNGSSNESRSMTPSSYYSSDKTTPSPVTELKRDYSSSSSNINSPSGNDIFALFADFFDRPYRVDKPKFDDHDIEYQLKRSLQRTNLTRQQQQQQQQDYLDKKTPRQPRCVKYTFSSSKYDGNPIARRTVEYD